MELTWYLLTSFCGLWMPDPVYELARTFFVNDFIDLDFFSVVQAYSTDVLCTLYLLQTTLIVLLEFPY